MSVQKPQKYCVDNHSISEKLSLIEELPILETTLYDWAVLCFCVITVSLIIIVNGLMLNLLCHTVIDYMNTLSITLFGSQDTIFYLILQSLLILLLIVWHL